MYEARIEINNEQTELLEESYVIGRSKECDIVVADHLCSRKHARLFSDGTIWYLEDLNSSNGVTVNGKKLNPGEQVELGNGDAIVLATTTAINFFQDIPEEEEATTVLNPDEYEDTAVLPAVYVENIKPVLQEEPKEEKPRISMFLEKTKAVLSRRDDCEQYEIHFCPECGKKIPENSAFCKYCGRKLK